MSTIVAHIGWVSNASIKCHRELTMNILGLAKGQTDFLFWEKVEIFYTIIFITCYN